ncbi:macro domain-containing protein [bacterium]|nr:macro domain-containing protein [bacterium]
MKHRMHQTDIELIDDDITTLNVDAIVNAANSRLAHGGGVAGVISRKGGPAIQEESNIWVKTRGVVPAGEVAITSAGDLPARYVIHAVGPRQGEGMENKKLKNATLNSLKMADSRLLKSIALPAISTGIFGYPMDKCAKVMLSAVKAYVESGTGLERIVLCLFGEQAFSVFQTRFSKTFRLS